MSFPRAKIQRFNETQNCTPSPADYNPKINSHVAGTTISASERFTEPKTTPAGSDNVSVCSLNSTCFRTPTLPKMKKKRVPTSSTKVKSGDIFIDLDKETLTEKTVECDNKDVYIKELTEQLEEMKLQLNRLQSERDEFEEETTRSGKVLEQLRDEHKIEMENMQSEYLDKEKNLKEQIDKITKNLELAMKECEELKAQDTKIFYEQLIERMQDDHKADLENIQSRFPKDTDLLSEQLAKTRTEMELVREQYGERLANRKHIVALLQNIDKFQTLNDILMRTCKEEIQVKEEIIKKESEMRHNLKKDLDLLREAHAKEIEELKSKHKLAIEDIEYEMLKAMTAIQSKLEAEKTLKATYESKMVKMEGEHQLSLKQIEEYYKHESDKLIKEKIEEEHRLVENDWRVKLENQQQHSQKELQEALGEMEENWKIKLEAQSKESEDILKECQAIGEYNIIQCELEKNDIKNQLAKALDDIKNIKSAESLCAELQVRYDGAISDLKRAQDDLERERELHKSETQQILNEKHTFDVSVNKTLKTVDALTKRLIDSDRDVEQLKSELECCEKAKLEAEDKSNKLTVELETVRKMYDDVELQAESNLKLSQNTINEMEKKLLDQVDKYKRLIKECIVETDKKLQEKNSELEDMKELLYQQQISNTEAQCLISSSSVELEKLSEDNARLEAKVSTLSSNLEEATRKIRDFEENNRELQNELNQQVSVNTKLADDINKERAKSGEVQSLMKELNQLQEKSDSYYQYCEYYKCKTVEYEKEIEELNVIQKSYIDQSGKYDKLLQKYEALVATNAELLKKIAEQESLIGPFREQLEAYEIERGALINQKHDAENEAKLMGMKYAQILGHQNQKQKIKHLINLKCKNYELMENKAEMELKLKTQSKTIEKLKKELASLSKTRTPKKQSISDKENVNSPSSLNNSHISSPLRQRNQN